MSTSAYMQLDRLKPLFKKTFSMLERLSSKPAIGGLQVTNGAISYVRIEKSVPQTFSLRLPPGVVEGGKIVAEDQFTELLKKLHAMIVPGKEGGVVQVTVSLPAESVFTQGFEVPNVNREKLDETAGLNLQMISPLPAKDAYMSWGVITESPERFELLGAFTEKQALDALARALRAAGFYAVAFEFPSLSLTRLLAGSAALPSSSTLLLHVSSDGVNISIIRGKKLSFDYFRSWKSIQGESRQISRELFDRVIAEESQKVAYFALSRFQETVGRAFFVAPGFENEVKEALETRLSLPASPFPSPSGAPAPVWYVAWGAALREADPVKSGHLINLNYESSADVFFEEHAVSFVVLWRNILAIVLLFFLLVYGIASSFLAGQLRMVQGRLAASKSEVNGQEFTSLSNDAASFNAMVAALKAEPRDVGVWYSFLTTLSSVASANGVGLDRIDVSSFSSPVQVIAHTSDNTKVVAFKSALEGTNGFSNVDLPLLGIQQTASGTVSFSISFTADKGSFAANP